MKRVYIYIGPNPEDRPIPFETIGDLCAETGLKRSTVSNRMCRSFLYTSRKGERVYEAELRLTESRKRPKNALNWLKTKGKV